MKNIFFCLLLATATVANAQTDTIKLPGKQLHTEYLKPGMNQYLIVMTNPKMPKSSFLWYWLRTIKKEKHNNIPAIMITQRWYAADTMAYRSVYSINRASDFDPIYHSETVRGKTNAYNWTATRINGADSVANNSKKGFTLDFSAPNYNWNLDIETFEMLPLAAGKVFAINFYDAGLGPPKYVTHKVTGSEVISYGGKPVDCWKLFTQGTSGKISYTETYWISKVDHEFLREEDDYGQGMHRSKIKMPVNVNM
ncbi:hypothetical protein SNE25_26340 [Mucilaginibacter sabulilitoris]|uniref:Uncharacterized protein n=1 Tax=Mucilaginibacter sabulilitoris TaxID=1173583 RepID=A0ABZ0TII6_9SPHI|nr:hypothetical protein [Mucilaginibacter sabulilitoris]WPU92848.1 hypothetical protein SNE25_26340 [Mucilaginibacter sabulilitoris]